MPTTMYCIWAMNFIADTTENFSRVPHFDKRGDVDVLQATCLDDMMKLGCGDDEDGNERCPNFFSPCACSIPRGAPPRRQTATTNAKPQEPLMKSSGKTTAPFGTSTTLPLMNS